MRRKKGIERKSYADDRVTDISHVIYLHMHSSARISKTSTVNGFAAHVVISWHRDTEKLTIGLTHTQLVLATVILVHDISCQR